MILLKTNIKFSNLSDFYEIILYYINKLKRRHDIVLKSLLILLSSVIFYRQDLSLLLNEGINNEALSYILIIPFLISYIIYVNRKYIIASIYHKYNSHNNYTYINDDLLGIFLVLISWVIKWYGSYTFTSLEYHMLSSPIFISGLIIIVFNKNTFKSLLFPIIYLFFLIPIPFSTIQEIGYYLSNYSSHISYNALLLLNIPVSLSETYGSPIIILTTLKNITIPFTIDVACSGIYSFIGFLVFTIFISYIAKGKFIKKLLIFVIGFPIIYCTNILRIIIIIIIGYIFGPGNLLDLFHLFGGWTLIFFSTILLLIISGKYLSIKFSYNKKNECTHLVKNNERFCRLCGQVLNYPKPSFSKNERLRLFATVIFLTTLFFLQVPVFNLSQSDANIIIQKPTDNNDFLSPFPEISGYNIYFYERDRDFENISGQDASLWYYYQATNYVDPTVHIGLEIGPTKGCLHAWEACYITTPQSRNLPVWVNQLDLRDIQLLDNPPLIARYFAFMEKDTNYTRVILYWYTRSVFRVGNQHQEKWVKISAIIDTFNQEEYQKIEEVLYSFALAIAEYWKPLSQWSQISLFIAKSRTSIAFLLAMMLLTYIYLEMRKNNQKKKRATLIFTNITFSEDKQILYKIKQILKKNTRLTEITLPIQIDGIEVNENILHSKILEAERAGLLERKLVKINDEPYLTWDVHY